MSETISNWEFEILNDLDILWEERGSSSEPPPGAIQMLDSETWACGPENWADLSRHAFLIHGLAENARLELRELVAQNPCNQWEETFKRHIQKPSLLDSFFQITEAHVAAATEYAIAFAMADCDFPEYRRHLRKARHLIEHCSMTYEDMMRATYPEYE